MRPATSLICQFIDKHKQAYGVVPICRALAVQVVQIAPRTYWAHRSVFRGVELRERKTVIVNLLAFSAGAIW